MREAGVPGLPGKSGGATPHIVARFGILLTSHRAPSPPTILPQPGGCTFAEDPARDCAQILPIWSAVADPCVLQAQVVAPAMIPDALWFDLGSRPVRRVQGGDVEHLAFLAGGEIARLDVRGGLGEGDRFALRFEVTAALRMEGQMRAIRRIYLPVREEVPSRLMRLHQSLFALDAHAAGASLRETADLVLGAGVWPGDGEHRKSRTRRLIEAGERLVRCGPEAVLR